jgi:hypothetical protein
MKAVYEFDKNVLDISEKDNGEDKEFNIKLLDPSLEDKVHEVRDFFEHNKVYTDVLFYTHSDHSYQFIVKNEYCTDFILKLFKEKLVKTISWS